MRGSVEPFHERIRFMNPSDPPPLVLQNTPVAPNEAAPSGLARAGRFVRRTSGAWGLAALCLFLFFWRLGGVPLFDLDEALYVACARQMVRTGDVVTPKLNTRPFDHPAQTLVPFYEKPILVYWVSAASMRAGGVSERSARLPSALAALLTTGLVVLAGTRWFGRRAGLLAGLVYATAPMTIADARQMTTDGLLTLWTTGALFAFWTVWRRIAFPSTSPTSAFPTPAASSPPSFPDAPVASPPAATWTPALIFWGACALATLTKGVVGLLLPGLILTVFLLREGRVAGSLQAARWRQIVGALHPLAGLLLFFALAAPWHIAIWRAGGHDGQGRTWVQEYLIRQHVGRFRGGDKVHNAPLPTYLLYFLLGFFPWACFTPAAFRVRSPRPRSETGKAQAEASARNRNAPTAPALLPARAKDASITPFQPDPAAETTVFLRIWFWAIVGFFTLGAAKLPTYIVPAYPAAALLVGRWLSEILTAKPERAPSRALDAGAFAALLTAGLLVAGALIAPRFARPDAPVPESVLRLARHLTLTLFAGSALGWACFRAASRPGDALASNARPVWRRAGLGALTAMTIMLAFIGYTEGYAVAARDLLGPYQRIAALANPTSDRPTLYYNIVPRRPSMNFYADYAPLEGKQKPLLPELRALLAAGPFGRTLAVATSRRTLGRDLLPELAQNPGWRAQTLAATGEGANGWVLVELQAPAPNAPSR